MTEFLTAAFWIAVCSTWAGLVLWMMWHLFVFGLFLPDWIAEAMFRIKMRWGLRWFT